ncbi:PTS system D-mannitol-specific IIA component (Fru family) [Sinobaca qinghaiensis]|uniref:Mannitol-specific phosphotransferase enzyme IIA component n=1 Tax=Sinobaca qinghaiensis TaxID=342944 RepID=A0A419V405_9BACL|nr:PTS sugar transporter subunit IIA [Sinobaca qinghaiensis]RKD73259.1 PTS system D-mannitol-specific IIA component (Fru family) [Sinobaca qinghaiensis]
MSSQILKEENVVIGAALSSKEEAIRTVGNILVDQGYVETDYIASMMEREELTSTYMGNYIAIPHGTEDSKSQIKSSGLSIVQAPDGVDYGDGNKVKLLIGIAGKGDEHLEILSKIALVCSDADNVEKMLQATTKQELLAQFEEVK